MSITVNQMQSIVDNLATADLKLAKVIKSNPLCTIGAKPSGVTNFESLVESVVSQQLSVKAADTIHARLKELCKGTINPQQIGILDEEALKAVGLSAAKTKSIRGLADASNQNAIDFENLHLATDEAISNQLNALWGIGPWTVDMFMMFQLGRLDVWPVGDLGVRRGWKNIFELPEMPEPKQLVALGERFRGHRSVVAWYCWRAA